MKESVYAHCAFCQENSVPEVEWMPATDCFICAAWDAGYEAGYANGEAESAAHRIL